MKANKRLLIGTLLTVSIFAVSKITSANLGLGNDHFSQTVIHFLLLSFLSIAAIITLKPLVKYKIKSIKLKTVVRPIFLSIGITLFINASTAQITNLMGGSSETHIAFQLFNPMQIFLCISSRKYS